MKILKALFLTLAIGSFGSYAQDIPDDELPIATLDENYHLTLNEEMPLEDYYRVDISHFEFASEEEAIKQCRLYLSGNLISNEVHYGENYLIVHIHTEYMGDDVSHERFQAYLELITKPL